MNRMLLSLLSIFLISCAGTPSPDVAAPELASTGSDTAATVATLDPAKVLTVDLADSVNQEHDIVCRKETRPGTRMVVGEVCRPRSELGVSVATREEIQREMQGQGWSSGWKTEQQIEAERNLSLPSMMLSR